MNVTQTTRLALTRAITTVLNQSCEASMNVEVIDVCESPSALASDSAPRVVYSPPVRRGRSALVTSRSRRWTTYSVVVPGRTRSLVSSVWSTEKSATVACTPPSHSRFSLVVVVCPFPFLRSGAPRPEREHPSSHARGVLTCARCKIPDCD